MHINLGSVSIITVFSSPSSHRLAQGCSSKDVHLRLTAGRSGAGELRTLERALNCGEGAWILSSDARS